MAHILFDIPADVDQTLREQALRRGIDAEEYIKHSFGLFLSRMVQRPDLRVRVEKWGWDSVLVAQDLFAKYVREQPDDIELNLQISQVAEPDSTPQQRAAAIRAWANHPRRQIPILSDEDLSRESLYGDSA